MSDTTIETTSLAMVKTSGGDTFAVASRKTASKNLWGTKIFSKKLGGKILHFKNHNSP